MAEGGISKLTVKSSIKGINFVDVADWKDVQNTPYRHQKRSEIVHAIIQHRHTDYLRHILHHGWDVNETLYMNDDGMAKKKETALHEASREGWSEGVRLLLHAGANYNTPGVKNTPLQLAVQNPACPVDVIELLIQHGADPNDHDGESIPLFEAISGTFSGCEINEAFIRILQVLLENGADPNATFEHQTGTGKALDHLTETFLLKRPAETWQFNVSQCAANAVVFKTLIQFGADVNCDEPLLHKILGSGEAEVETGCDTYPHILTIPYYIFLQEHLDSYFQYGGNIHKEFSNLGTGLEFAIHQICHSNSIRWLIRHGADVSTLKFGYLRGAFVKNHADEAPLILLQAGMRVSQEIHQLIHSLQEETLKLSAEGIEAIWQKLEKEEISIRLKKFFPEYMTTQMVDLEEFSDDSLKIYPEVNIPDDANTNFEAQKEFILRNTRLMVEFLSQPQSLQWYSRRCVRENLVSLQPSVVKTLPLPCKLKRFVLCHEI